MDDDGTARRAPVGVLYLVVSGAPAPEGIPALVAACQAAGWQVVVFPTPTGIRFVDPAEVEQLTGEQARSAYQAYQATRYDATGRILPGLIHGVETSAWVAGSASPAVARCALWSTTPRLRC